MQLTRRAVLAAGTAAMLPWRSIKAAESDELPWLAEIQQPPAKFKPAKLRPLLVDGSGARITTREQWQQQRKALRKTWLESVLFPFESEHPGTKLEVLEEDRPDGCIRQLVRYETEPGVPVEGYLLKPAVARGKVPGVVVLHSTVDHTIRQPAGVEGDSRQFFGLRLARRGLVAFCPRCYLWQGPGTLPEHVAALFKRHPGTTGMAKMLWDASRGLDVLAALPEVDANRLGAVGHSLGAKETLYLTAFDERVKAAAFSEGGIGLGFSNWEAPWYLGARIQGPTFEREHHELLALCAPRPFLLVGGESADGDASWPYVEAAKSVYELWGKPAPIGLYNHRQGHAVPEVAQDRIESWLDHYLRK